ncbi:MAG: hypothetical protein IJW64_05180 [Clostridia bacterium]|nr:hypothetical protein [Clostridia bacterium]
MKKLLSHVLTLCVCFCITISLTACLENSETEHTHDFDVNWSYNETHHWHACKEKTCEEISQKNEHSMANNKCSICDYSLTPTPISWASYFVFDNVTISLDVISIIENEEYSSNMATKKYDGAKWLEINTDYDDETYEPIQIITYCDGENVYENGVLIAGDDAYSSFDVLNLFSSCGNSFTEISDDVYYAETVEYMGYTLYEKVTVTILNKKLSSIEIDLSTSDSNSVMKYSFSDWGATVVTEPVIEEQTTFELLFNFENVTITCSNNLSILKNVWKIDYDKWICKHDLTAVDNVVVETTVLGYDGENYYKDGETTNDIDSVEAWNFNLETVLLLKDYENSFTKTVSDDTTVYCADEITIYSSTWSNVMITAQNGRITEIRYTRDNLMDENGEPVSGTVIYTFTDYGTTTVTF